MEQHLVSDSMILPLFAGACSTLCLVLLASAAFVLVTRRRQVEGLSLGALRRELTAALLLRRGPFGGGGQRGLSIQVTDRTVAQRALVQHSAVFLDRPAGAVPSTILTRNRHCNILSAPYGPYWRAVRRNVAAGVLHPSRLPLLAGTRARALGNLVRDLGAGAPAGESLHFAVYSVLAEMCFGRDVVDRLGEARLRAMRRFQYDILLALPSFGMLVRFPTMGKLLYPSRWRKLHALRRQQEELFLPLVAEIKTSMKALGDDDATFKTYVESLLDVRIHEDGGRAVADGEIVSLISEFLGAGTESTAAALEWTMANLVKHPDVQRKLRAETDAVATIEEAELSRMPYLRAVVLESLRRHPPLPFVLRHVEGEEAAAAIGVPSLPYGGATVNFLVGKIGRDPAAWSDPMAFAPERFMPGGEGEGVDLTCTRDLRMMPFGAGRRICPGLAPAMHHLQYFVANLVREFEWREAADDGDKVDLAESRGLFVTFMKHPLHARLVPRGVDVAAPAAQRQQQGN